MPQIDSSTIASFRLGNSTAAPVYIPDSAWSQVPPGVSTYSGPVGEAPTGTSLHLALVIDTLASMLPTMSSEDAQAAVTFALNNIQQQESSNTVATEQEQQELQQTLMQVATQLAQQSEAKLQQAQSDTNGVNIWNEIKCALQIFGALVSIVVGIILIASGAGAVAGALMVASGIMGILGGVNSALLMATGSGIAGKGQAESDFTMAVAVIGLALAVGGLLAGGGDAIGDVAQIAELVAAGINAANTVVSGVGDGIAGYFTYQAATDQATAQSLSGQQQQDQAAIDQITATIKAIAKQASEDFKAIAAAFTSEMQLVAQTGTTIANVKFVV